MNAPKLATFLTICFLFFNQHSVHAANTVSDNKKPNLETTLKWLTSMLNKYCSYSTKSTHSGSCQAHITPDNIKYKVIRNKDNQDRYTRNETPRIKDTRTYTLELRNLRKVRLSKSTNSRGARIKIYSKGDTVTLNRIKSGNNYKDRDYEGPTKEDEIIISLKDNNVGTKIKNAFDHAITLLNDKSTNIIENENLF